MQLIETFIHEDLPYPGVCADIWREMVRASYKSTPVSLRSQDRTIWQGSFCVLDILWQVYKPPKKIMDSLKLSLVILAASSLSWIEVTAGLSKRVADTLENAPTTPPSATARAM
ncbi:hypothetical protein PoB_002822100 [Plakobranchus ocellatus]|uniref:Uncharacterized protein n=1 Tax=Plakobranchus ocellatus TaxID=259542 RepID=A0AAV4A0N2_9GAST|nr:hypothetical protein PoB_002822100 [Plakobranchus ocellatus]